MASFVRFVRDFDYSPPGAAWGRSYAAGWTVLVPDDHADAAEAARAISDMLERRVFGDAEAAGAGERVERKDIDPDDERVFPQGPVEKPAKGRR